MKHSLLVSLLTLSFLPAHADPPPEPAPDRPNILFIYSDDQAYDTIRELGFEEIETPNLDKLVFEGTTFTHAYNMGSWAPAVCVASRTMLVSGQTLWNSGVHSWASGYKKARNANRAKKGRKDPNSPAISEMAEILADYEPQGVPDDFKAWPELMKEAGYHTFFAGKWHTSFNTSMFNQTGTVRSGMPVDKSGKYRNRPQPGKEDTWKPWDKDNQGYWKGGTHWSEVLANEAVDYLENDKSEEKPFFMYVAFNAPHDPRQSPESFVKKYPVEKLPVPQPFLPEYPFAHKIFGKRLRDEALAPYPRTEEAVKVHRQEYYALISHMDEQIGRILDALEESGQADNTLIIFTSDHGLACGRHGMMGKQNMYEHSLRVPLILTGPGIPQGKKIEAPVYYQDVMATTLEIAGTEKPDYVYFQSLLPLIQGETKESVYPAIYGAYFDTQRAVIHDGYKLLVYPYAPQQLRLYHLEKDPEETQDLALKPESKEIMKKLAAKLQELQKEMSDPMDLSAILNKI